MKSILIATTNLEHLITLADLLQERGYLVIPSAGADFALSLLRQGLEVDAVIADYEMADFQKIKSAVRCTPVIVMSERVAVTDYLAALSAGAFEFFFWPVQPAEFLRVVCAAVRRNSEQSDAAVHQHGAAATAARSASGLYC